MNKFILQIETKIRWESPFRIPSLSNASSYIIDTSKPNNGKPETIYDPPKVDYTTNLQTIEKRFDTLDEAIDYGKIESLIKWKFCTVVNKTLIITNSETLGNIRIEIQWDYLKI